MFPSNIVAATTDEQLIAEYNLLAGNQSSVSFGYIRFTYGALSPDEPMWGVFQVQALFGSNDFIFRLLGENIVDNDTTFNHINIAGDFGFGQETRILQRSDATYAGSIDGLIGKETAWNWVSFSSMIDGNNYTVTLSRTSSIPEVSNSTLRATDPGALFAEDTVQFTILPGVPIPNPVADYVVSQNGAGDFTNINAALSQGFLVPGDIIEIRADVPGTEQVFTENVLFNNIHGSDGLEIVLRARDGDNIIIKGTGSGTNIRFHVIESSFLIVDGIKQIGANTWSNSLPIATNGTYESTYGVWVESNSTNIEFRNIGEPGGNTDYKIWGANNYSANQFGRFGSPDGCSLLKIDNCWFELQGTNNETTRTESKDWGDLFRQACPQVVIQGGSFAMAGHNTLSIEQGPCIIRDVICDNDWRSKNTGLDGYRACEISTDKANIPPSGTGEILCEGSIFRNSFKGAAPSASSASKWQANRGVFRYNQVANARQLGIKNDRNVGADGSVTESKFYHNTFNNVESLLRTSENSTTYTDVHFEYDYVNSLVMNLGAGDVLSADSYIYMTDRSSDLGGFPDAWKGDQWRGLTVDITGTNFRVRLEGNSGVPQFVSFANLTTTWPQVFSNIDDEVVNFSSPLSTETLWNYATAYAGLTPTNSPPSLTNIEDLTSMVGSGTSQTSGVFEDGRYFILADTDWGLGYFGEQNDQVDIGGTVVRLLTLNKDTGAATWDLPVTWVNGDPVNHAPNGVKATQRGAVQ